VKLPEESNRGFTNISSGQRRLAVTGMADRPELSRPIAGRGYHAAMGGLTATGCLEVLDHRCSTDA
jgi:hypothetical protein